MAKAAVTSLVKCYSQWFLNSLIFVPAYTVPITTGHESVLEADLICLRELFARRPMLWQFYLNPAGTALPLKSHENIRRILKNNSERNFQDVQLNDMPERQEHLMVFER